MFGSKTLVVIYKIFFIGLLLQFVLFNIVTFQFGLSGGYIDYLWLWKEGLIGLLLILTILQLLIGGQWKQILRPSNWKFWQLLLILLIGITLAIDLIVHQQGIGGFALAFKYDLFGFVIFFLGLHTGSLLDSDQKEQLTKWYGRVIKRLLGAAIIWYLVIAIKPGTLKLLGYDNYVFEGTVGQAAPAAYYTEINQGITRNQFVFERPVSRGFFLVAMRPLFYLLFLHRQPLSQTWARWCIYGFNVFLTFSRAAWGSRLILCFLIGLFVFWGQRKKLLIFTIAPLLTLGAVFFALGGASLLTRGFSDTGHVTMVMQGWQMAIEKPITGRGGASVGPGSHHEGGMAYNPENQFLQIWIEYGFIVFILRSLLFFGIAWTSFWKYDEQGKALALGIIGLAISGMVLHSFSDRMIVYPMMLLWGIIVSSNTSTGKLSESSYTQQ